MKVLREFTLMYYQILYDHIHIQTLVNPFSDKIFHGLVQPQIWNLLSSVSGVKKKC